MKTLDTTKGPQVPGMSVHCTGRPRAYQD